ncbi:hypothetical protein OROHE_007724 [Orobanche hederae]
MSYIIRLMRETMRDEEEEAEQMLTMATAVQQYRQLHNESSASQHGGSTLNHRVINRNREEGHARLYRDYFSDTPTYPETMFRRRFRMRRPLFLSIEGAITAHDSYFTQKIDVVAVRGLSSIQKITTTLRMLAYGTAADSVDEYIRIGESTTIESLKRFVKAVVEVFGPEYLRRPNMEDTTRLLAVAKQRGFPGMLGSIDCMHWKWKNCPTASQGTYTGHVHETTIILEAIASYDLWIWHSFFGLPGSLNDINVLDRSNVFHELAEDRGPEVNFSINGHEYKMGYYLARYKRKYFATAQEAARKDVERAFGVLQSRFAIIRGPSRFWDVDIMKYIMTSCVILHNMIVEDERELNISDFNYDTDTPTISMNIGRTRDIEEFIQIHRQIRDKQAHIQLQNDLVEHLWQCHGGNM